MEAGPEAISMQGAHGACFSVSSLSFVTRIPSFVSLLTSFVIYQEMCSSGNVLLWILRATLANQQN